MVSHLTQDFEKLILEEIERTGKLNTYEFAKDLQRDHQLIVGAVKSIQSVGEVRKSSYIHVLFPIKILLYLSL